VQLDLSQLVMSGHSFGGMTTIEVAKSDPRVKITLTMDPWLFCRHLEITSGLYTLDKPHFAISTEDFHPACENWFDSLNTLKKLQAGVSPIDFQRTTVGKTSLMQEHVIVRHTGH
jgi:cephalosporin-C deacetylase-like acetyl esterase